MPKLIPDRQEHIEYIKAAIPLCTDKHIKRLLQSQLTYHVKPRKENPLKMTERIKRQISKYNLLLTQTDLSPNTRSNYDNRIAMLNEKLSSVEPKK